MRGAAAGDDQERRGIVHGAGAGADRVEQPRPLVDDHRREAAADAVIEVGHVHRMVLVLGLDALDLRLLGQRVEEGPHRAARIAEIVLESGDLEPAGDGVHDTHEQTTPEQ
jgi:hypothetical protein